MRLLVVSQYFWPENFRINDLVAELVRRGHQVTVLTGVPNYPDGRVFPEYRMDPSSFARHEGASIIRVPMVARGRDALRLVLNYATFALSALVLGSFRLRGQTFDAIFVFEPSPITVGLPAVWLRRVKRAPVALWVLDLWPNTLEAIGVLRSPRLLALVGRLVTFVYERCDLILAQSRSFIPQIEQHCRSEKRIEYFPSWAEGVFDSAQVAAADDVPPFPSGFTVMFAGNIGDAQDFPAILDAASCLADDPRIRWVLIGDGRMSDWVRTQIDQRGLARNVLMMGRHPVERMPSFYAHADALLVSLRRAPIFAMTIPGKLQSYLASGKAVVAMLDGEGADVVRRSGAGLTCPAGDAAGLAAAVRQMAAMPRACVEEMGRRAAAFSRAEFSRARLIHRLECALADLADRQAGRRSPAGRRP